MESTDPREYEVSPGADVEASISSGPASGKAGKMPGQEGEIMDIEYFSEQDEGKKKRRRGRLIIFVDESEERTRWVPWVLLAAVIVGAVVAAVVIIRFAVNNDDGTQSSAAKRVDLSGGQYTSYQECASMMARLRSTSQTHEFSSSATLSGHQTRWNKGIPVDEALDDVSTADGQHDILAPAVDDMIYLGDTLTVSDNYGLIYTSAGTQLKILSAGYSSQAADASSNATSIVATLDFANIGVFQHRETLEVSNGQRSLAVPYGLGNTFQVEQLFLPLPSPGSTGLLAVVGSATNAAPNPGASPKLTFESQGIDEFLSSDLRPFNTTVLVLVNIANPVRPTVVSISEFEGEFVTIDREQSHYWLFVRSSAHVPDDHSSGDDSKLDMGIMPLFRNLPVAGETIGVLEQQWQHMGDCSDVSRLELGVPRVGNNHLLAAIPVLIQPIQPDHQVGFVQAEDISLSVQGWEVGMVPVLISRTPDRLNMYVAESIWYTAQVSSSTSESESSVITAVSHFRLSGGIMTYTNYTINDGQVPFQGAMQFLQDPPRLSLLTSQYGDSTGGVLRSSLTIYSPTLSQESQSVGQFRERQPVGAIYPSNDHVFISFTVQSRPLVQVLPTQAGIAASRNQNGGSGGPLELPQQSVQRRFLLESADLMKAIVMSENDTSLAYILLVAGYRVPVVEDDSSVTGDRADSPTQLQDDEDDHLQFSLYAYTSGASSSIEVPATFDIATSALDSEAFRDPRAALLFQVPDDVEGHAYFALPVMITKPTTLLADLGCLGPSGFSGILIWRLAFAYTSRDGFQGGVTVQRSAAVPASGSCGYGSGAGYKDVAVRRIRTFMSDGDLHLAVLSRCNVATVPWASIMNAASANASEDAWQKVEAQSEPLFVDSCPDSPI